MRSVILIAFLATIPFTGFTQSKFNVDSLTREICNTVKAQILETDSLTLTNALQKHLVQYIDQTDEKSWELLLNNCYLRLQRECPEFRYLLDRLEPPKGDWKRVSEEPGSKVSPQDCIDFFKISSFKYREVNGDTSTVIITDSTWTDHFLDGTSSKLSLVKTNNCDFIITFIESNNPSRSGFSKRGDKYRYKIIQKFDTYFEMFTEIAGKPMKQIFRLYY